MQRRNEPFWIALARSFDWNIFDHEELQPVEQFRRRGFLLQSWHFADFVKQLERLGDESMLDAGKMDLDDRPHRVRIGKADVMEKAAAQERVRQFFFIV